MSKLCKCKNIVKREILIEKEKFVLLSQKKIGKESELKKRMKKKKRKKYRKKKKWQ